MFNLDHSIVNVTLNAVQMEMAQSLSYDKPSEPSDPGWLLAMGVLIWILLGLTLFRIGIEIQRRHR
jgi:hypothetical protein